MIKQSIARILSVELDRKDFLKALGFGIVAATGVTAAVNTVVKQTAPAQSHSSVMGYGDSVYGGKALTR